MSQQLNSAIDVEQLNQISEGDIEFEIEILQVYVEDTSQRIHKISEAIAIQDYPQIMKQAHHIKGSSSNVGALQMRLFALQLEHLDQNQDSQKLLSVVLALIDNMLKEIQTIEQFIAAKADTLPS